ncbi:MAG: glycosyltransferase family 39 protein [Verrucomicrobiota bacterium]
MTPVASQGGAAGRIKSLVIVGGASLVALYAGFLRFSPAACDELVRTCGYGWMAALTVLAGVAVARVVAESGGCRWLARTCWPSTRQTLLITGVWLWLLNIDAPGYKILFDEPVQSSTAMTLHTEREFATTVRAYHVNEVFTVLKAYLDKRPPLFPFLVAVVHDVTGYRMSNAFIVNAVGTLGLVVLVWFLGRRYGGGPGGGGCAIALLATLPLLGITATSAGMDLVNLTMLAAVWLAIVLYLDRPSEPRTMLMIVTVALLAYCRYESVLYVGGVAVAWVLSSWRRRSWKVEPIWGLLPLSLVLYAWHNTVLSNTPALWELRPEQTHRFSFEYAANNLSHAGRFLFAVDRALPNSALISIFGIVGLLVVLGGLVSRRTKLDTAEGTGLAIVGAGAGASFAMLMCYYWGELDDPIVSRLSLPLHLLFVVVTVAAWRQLAAESGRWFGGWRLVGLATGVVWLAITVPAAAGDRYTTNNFMRRNFEWERRIVAQFWPTPGLVISNRSPICWLADGIPSVSVDRARLRLDELRWHMERHSFGTVLVMQRVLTRGADGGWAVDATDVLPERCRLEEIAVRRLGATLTRVSRVVAIDPEPAR